MVDTNQEVMSKPIQRGLEDVKTNWKHIFLRRYLDLGVLLNASILSAALSTLRFFCGFFLNLARLNTARLIKICSMLQ